MYKFIIPLFALAFLLVSCSSDKPADPSLDSSSSMPSAQSSSSTAFDGEILSGKHTVILRTSKGDITLELDADAAPKTVTNFVALARSGYYDNLVFHRVIPEFMIQGGDPKGDGTGGASVFGETFEDEINAKSYGLDRNKPAELEGMTVKEFYESKGYSYDDSLRSLPMTKGAIAMANRGPNTNGSQFFIVDAQGTPWLEGQHTVFGRVTAGLDVVTAIANVERDLVTNRPKTPVTFTVEVVE